MPQLIGELKDEHERISTALTQVKELKVSTAEGQAKLAEAKNMLLDHLKKEDEKLYPVLNGAASSNEDLQRTLNVFAVDMEGISTAALDFFSKYDSADEKGSVSFVMDFGKLMGALGIRIKREESKLYEEYLKIRQA